MLVKGVFVLVLVFFVLALCKFYSLKPEVKQAYKRNLIPDIVYKIVKLMLKTDISISNAYCLIALTFLHLKNL